MLNSAQAELRHSSMLLLLLLVLLLLCCPISHRGAAGRVAE
jgi:hypothetical protein